MAWSYRKDRGDEVYADAGGPAVCDGVQQPDVPSAPYPPVSGGGGASSFAELTGDFALTQTPSAAASTVVGRGSSGAGDWQFLTLGAHLTITGTVLDSTAGGTITGGTLVAGRLVSASSATNIVDSGLLTTDVALVAQLPDDLSDLTISDGFIARNKLNYVGLALPATGSNLAPGTIYYGDISANYSITGFSPTMVEGNASIVIYAHFTNSSPITLTVPTCIRNADSGSTTTVTIPGAQYAVIQFFKIGSGDIRMLDNIQRGDDVGFVSGTMDGAGVTLIPGKLKGYITVPYAGTVRGWSVGANAGTLTFQVWKKATGTAVPTVTDLISDATGQKLTTGTYLRSTDMSHFTGGVAPTVTAGDIFALVLASVDSGSPTEATFAVEIKKT